MGRHGPAGPALVLLGQPGAQLERVGQRDLRGHVAGQRVVGGGLVGDDVEPLPDGRPGRLDLGGVADQRDADRLAVRGRGPRPGERLVRVAGQPVDVADVEPPPGARLVDLDDDGHAVVHGHRQRLGAAHPAQPRGQGHGPAEGAAEVLAGRLGERLVGALEDALGPDVDPGAGGHLPVHHQPASLEVAEVVPGRPLADEVRVGDEHARRPRMGPQDADRLARLDEQRLVVPERPQLADDRVEGGPRPRRPAGPAVDDEVVRVLGDLRIEVVHEHPERGFLLPAAAGQLAAAGGADRTRADGAHGLGHRGQGTRSGEVAAHDREALVRDRAREADRLPELGCRGARGVRCGADLRIGLDRGEAAPGEVLADRRDQGAGEAGATCLGRRRDAGDDRGQGRIRQGRVEVTGALGARVRGQRPELRVDRRDVVAQQDLGIAPRDAETAAQQLQLARRVAADRRAGRRSRRERVVDAACRRRPRRASGTGSRAWPRRTGWPRAWPPRGPPGTGWRAGPSWPASSPWPLPVRAS